jgi:hypothetical protein
MAWFWILPLSAHEMARPEPNPEQVCQMSWQTQRKSPAFARFTLHDAASPLPGKAAAAAIGHIPAPRQLATLALANVKQRFGHCKQACVLDEPPAPLGR